MTRDADTKGYFDQSESARAVRVLSDSRHVTSLIVGRSISRTITFI